MQENTTYRQSLGVLGGSIVGQWRTTTAPHQRVTMRQHAYAWLGRLLLGLLVTLAMAAAAVANTDPKFIHVNCKTERRSSGHYIGLTRAIRFASRYLHGTGDDYHRPADARWRWQRGARRHGGGDPIDV